MAQVTGDSKDETSPVTHGKEIFNFMKFKQSIYFIVYNMWILLIGEKQIINHFYGLIV